MTMDGFHPDMQAWAEQLEAQRRAREQAQALAASRASQSLAQHENHEYDLLQAARLAGA